MPYLYQAQVEQRAKEFIQQLMAEGMNAGIVPNSFRDYMVKIYIADQEGTHGNISIYYSPKKNSFTLKTQELKNDSRIPALLKLWEGEAAISEGYAIYVDGSYIEEKIGYAAIILKDGDLLNELWGRVEDSSLAEMRQVAGEITGVLNAIEWCKQNNIDKVNIFYDFAGLEKWVIGDWQTGNALSQSYVQLVKQSKVDISWHKVTAHTGDRWNERADQLAKRGALQQENGESTTTNSVNVLENTAGHFINFLATKGIAANFEGILNHQYARVRIKMEEGQGICDIYNTRKRPISQPYLHDFKPISFQSVVEQLWKEYFESVPVINEASKPSEIEYYYHLLKPYRYSNIDFYQFAESLKDLYQEKYNETLDTYTLRYNFDALEAIYFRLKEESA